VRKRSGNQNCGDRLCNGIYQYNHHVIPYRYLAQICPAGWTIQQFAKQPGNRIDASQTAYHTIAPPQPLTNVCLIIPGEYSISQRGRMGGAYGLGSKDAEFLWLRSEIAPGDQDADLLGSGVRAQSTTPSHVFLLILRPGHLVADCVRREVVLERRQQMGRSLRCISVVLRDCGLSLELVDDECLFLRRTCFTYKWLSIACGPRLQGNGHLMRRLDYVLSRGMRSGFRYKPNWCCAYICMLAFVSNKCRDRSGGHTLVSVPIYMTREAGP
jgi:hypothetical protein